MVEQIYQRKQWMLLRLICAFAAVFLHVWAVSAPLAANVLTQAQSTSVAKGVVSFSIMTTASITKPVEQPPARAVAKPTTSVAKTKPTEPARVETAEVDLMQKKLVAENTESFEVGNEPSLAKVAPSAPGSTLPRDAQAGVHALAEMSEPKFVSPPSPPTYPTVARKRGQEGTVWVDIVLDAKGTQSQLQILKSSGVAVLDTAALSAVSHWRFKPYEVRGVGVPSRVRIPIEFSLN